MSIPIQATALWRWWGAELAAMAPRTLRGAGPKLVLDLRESVPVLRRRHRGAWQDVLALPADAPVPGRALRLLRGAGSRVVLAIPPAWVLRRTLRLPEAAATRLDAVLDFEIEAHIPLLAEEVLWTARLLRHLPEAGRIEVEVAVLPRRQVAGMAARLRAAGLGLPLLAAPDPGAWPMIPLDAVAPPRRGWQGRASAALAGVAALLAGHLALQDLHMQQEAVAAMEMRAAAARTAAARAEALEAEAAALRSRLAAAAALRARPPAVAVLEEVAQRLPDGAWLTELRLTGEALMLTGHAAAPDALIGMLGASPIFQEVRFAAPVTRGGREGADRVQIALRVTAPLAEMRTRTAQR